MRAAGFRLEKKPKVFLRGESVFTLEFLPPHSPFRTTHYKRLTLSTRSGRRRLAIVFEVSTAAANDPQVFRRHFRAAVADVRLRRARTFSRCPRQKSIVRRVAHTWKQFLRLFIFFFNTHYLLYIIKARPQPSHDNGVVTSSRRGVQTVVVGARRHCSVFRVKVARGSTERFSPRTVVVRQHGPIPSNDSNRMARRFFFFVLSGKRCVVFKCNGDVRSDRAQCRGNYTF